MPIAKRRFRPFLPTRIPGCALWLRSDLGLFQDAGITVATVNADPVGRWADQSGNARHYDQASATPKPSLRTNVVNGLPVVRFDENQVDRLVGADLSALTAAEVFIVLICDSDPAPFDIGLWGFGSSGQVGRYPYTDGHILDDFGSTARKDTGDPSANIAAWHLYNVVTTASEWTAFINGTQHYTTGTNTVGFLAATVLGADSTQGSGFAGDIAEVILYDAKLSAGNKTSVKSYIASRYGLTIA